MEWINTKEKLPETSGLYICCMRDGHNEFGIFEGFFRTATFHKHGDNGRFYSRCHDITDDVLLWLPLPQLPKT